MFLLVLKLKKLYWIYTNSRGLVHQLQSENGLLSPLGLKLTNWSCSHKGKFGNSSKTAGGSVKFLFSGIKKISQLASETKMVYITVKVGKLCSDTKILYNFEGCTCSFENTEETVPMFVIPARNS